jgi:TetR/AcrR family transcriptional repressor of nem operon
MSRPANPEVKDRLLSHGREVVHQNGFHACGVQDITNAAGIPKGSFYSYFASKDAFAVEILEVYWTEIKTLQSTARSSRDPVAALRAHFRTLSNFHEKNGFIRGCLIGNLALELGGGSEPVRVQLQDIFQRWQETIEEHIVLALPSTTSSECRKIAAALVDAYEGAVMRAKVEQSRAPFDRFENLVLARLIV